MQFATAMRLRTVVVGLLTMIWVLPLNPPRALAEVSGHSGSGAPLGIAWQVKGQWHVEDHADSLATGDAIEPGVLLTPVAGSPAHSITVLLPDGQRVLYECYQAEDCGRGFRVPELYREPEPLAISMLWRIHAALTEPGHVRAPADSSGTPLPRDEAVTMLDAHSHGEIAGLVAALPNGHYSYTEHEIGSAGAETIHKSLEKKGRTVEIEFPKNGLFDVLISDSQDRPRINLMIAALKSPEGDSTRDSFINGKKLLEDWNEDYQGWPIHDFHRAYLTSLMMKINPPVPNALHMARRQEKPRPGVVAEPIFSPKPGLQKGDTAVTLKCDTQGATIHFTVDGSQPFASSQVYSAPIIVKNTALTIKAFATAEGKRPSNVITGIFRIGD